MRLLHAQLSHSIGLNDLCDSLQLHSGPLSTIRGATFPSRNGLSHANRERSPVMAEQLFWRMLEHLKEQSPGFATGQRRGQPFGSKCPSMPVFSTTLELVANNAGLGQAPPAQSGSQDAYATRPAKSSARFRRRGHGRRARQPAGAGVVRGLEGAVKSPCLTRVMWTLDILKGLDERGVFWVTRAKEDLACQVVHIYRPRARRYSGMKSSG